MNCRMKNKLIESHSEDLDAIFKNHKITKAYIFGSALNDKFNEDSDIDFLIQFEKDLSPLEKGTLWWNLHDRLRDLLNREIDLLMENSLKNPYFIEEVNNTKQLIYG